MICEVKPHRILLVPLWLSLVATAVADPVAAQRSVSPSGEFVIYGDDAQLRGAISIAAETTKSNLLSLLRRRDSWTTPIVINLQLPAPNVPDLPSSALRFSRTESGLKLQLDLMISREMDSGEIERELLRAILLEMIYRRHSAIAAGETYVEPPVWLIQGLLAAMPNDDHARLVSILDVTEKTTPFAKLLRQKWELLDPAGRGLYRAYSFVLVQWLLETAETRARLGRYIDHLASAENDPVADFRSAFPEVAGKDFEKNWQSRIVTIKKSNALLTFSQTEEELSELLHANRLSGIASQRADHTEQLALKKLSDQLVLLSVRANPVLRPIVQQYQQLTARLAHGKDHGIASALTELEKLRARLSGRMTEVDDYMNWFEATQLNTSSGLFDIPSTRETQTSSAHRKDPLSIYLDAVEQQN